jgi:SpoVK/Ycf46/Vps4 family AAA+-type ATPase
MSNNLFISERFTKAIANHVAKNLLAKKISNVPLILGVHGPSGSGKTYQCERILREMEAMVFLISGGQLEHKDAGEPARLIRQTYKNASEAILEKKTKISVILMNDFDTGVGDWGEYVQTTVNRQTVFGELMHLVDYPGKVDNTDTRRIPIIITGNDFTKLYAPLVRAGRMTSFEWAPTIQEKSLMVSNIFPEFSLQECQDLVQELESIASKLSPPINLQVSFFSHLRSIIYDEVLWDTLKRHGINKVAEITSSPHPEMLSIQMTFEEIVQKAKLLLNSGQLINHLGSK